jgi:hypothetical protein
MQSLLSNSSTMSSTFGATLLSCYSDSFSWNANVSQTTFSLLSGSPESKYNFSQGVAVAGDWNVGERFTTSSACGENHNDIDATLHVGFRSIRTTIVSSAHDNRR